MSIQLRNFFTYKESRKFFCSSTLPVAALLFLSSLAVGDELRFSHQVTLHSIPPLQSIITFVPADGEDLKTVRALLQLDGELLVVPLLSEPGAKSYRGTFPTPKESLSFEFQVISTNGATQLTRRFEVSPECNGGAYMPQRAASMEIRRALSAQQQRKRLEVTRDLLKKFFQRLQ